MTPRPHLNRPLRVAGLPVLARESAWVANGRELVPLSPSASTPAAVLVIPDTAWSGTSPDPALLAGGPLPLGAWVAPAGSDGPGLASSFPFLKARLTPSRTLHILDDLVPDTRDGGRVHTLVQRVEAAGGRAVLVGGSVRDGLLGLPAKDFDIEVRGLPVEVLEPLLAEAFGHVDLVGASFAVYKVGTAIDVALPRRERKTGVGHTAFEVDVDPNLSDEAAASRRDFTVNAIGWDLGASLLVDPWNGAADLVASRLRHVSDQFGEDPLRVLRAARFSARLGLLPDPDTIDLCASLLPEAPTLAAERIFDEYALMLGTPTPSLGLMVLRDTGWLPAQLGALRGEPGRAGRDALASTAQVLDTLAASESPEDPYAALVLRMAGLTSFLSPADARALLNSLTRQKYLARDVTRVNQAATELAAGPVSDTRLAHLAEAADGLALAVRLAAAHASTDPQLGPVLTQRSIRMGAWHAPVPALVNGDDVIAAGVAPGPQVGRILAHVRAAQLDGKVTSRDQALRTMGAFLG